MILITGANGQLGNALAMFSNRQDLLLVNRSQCDITNQKQVQYLIQSHDITHIINCAAYTQVDEAERCPERAFHTNAEGTKILAQSAYQFSIPLIHISTDYVFSGSSSLPYKEDDLPSPLSVYGKSKFMGEQEVIKHHDNYIILRTSWLYSDHQHSFYKKILEQAKSQNEIHVVTDQWGSPTLVNTLASVIYKILPIFQQKKLASIFHYSSEGQCSWYDFACEIIHQGHLACQVVPVKTSESSNVAPRPRYSVLDKSRIKTTFKIEIPNWREELIRYMN